MRLSPCTVPPCWGLPGIYDQCVPQCNKTHAAHRQNVYKRLCCACMPETPKAPELRDQRLVIRLSLSEKKRIEDAAWEDRSDMSKWARDLFVG